MKKENLLVNENSRYVGEILESKKCGQYKVIDITPENKLKVRFLATGYEDTIFPMQLLNGEIHDYTLPNIQGCGFTGGRLCNGEHKSKAYVTWTNMLNRCYGKRTSKINSTYKGCVVSQEFLYYNLFKEWCLQQKGYYNKSWALDKDLLSPKGAKIYSRETCVFLPPEINSLLTTTKAKRGGLPIGVRYSKNRQRYQADIGMNGENFSLGIYDTKEEAFAVYKQAREDYLKVKADKYKEQLCERAYNALYNYTVELDD